MTAQRGEELILEGEQILMSCTPELPVGDPRIQDRGNAGDTGETANTGCWRGYIGTWEIRDEQLYLVKLRGRYRLRSEGPIPATWVNERLRIPRGELLDYRHMGFGSLHAEGLLLTVEAGVITRSETDRPGECRQCAGALVPVQPGAIAPVRHRIAMGVAIAALAGVSYVLATVLSTVSRNCVYKSCP